MAERPFEPVPNTPLVADPTGDAIWKRWLQNLQRFMGSAVRGPGSSTDNAVARWNGTTGTFLNNSGVIIDDSNNVSGVVNLTTTGSTILGDAAADTLTINAGTWTIGNNFTATREAGTVAAGTSQVQRFIIRFTGDAGGTSNVTANQFSASSNDANAVTQARNLLYSMFHNGTATVATLVGSQASIGSTSSGNVTTATGFSGNITLSGSGNVTTASMYTVLPPTFSSTGAITTLNGLFTNDIGNSKVTTANAINIQDITTSATINGIKSEISAGTGKTNLNITGTADNKLAGPLYLAQDNKTQQTAAAIYAGTGAPNNANGNNGDFYFRGDGTVAGNTVMYHKEAGAWVAFTTT